MTLQSHKKPRTTRSNIRLTSQCNLRRSFRWALCLCMAVVLITPAAEGGAAKRRRHSSLDRLKRRSATTRWEELRQIFQPSEKEASVPVVEDGTIQPARQESVGPDEFQPNLISSPQQSENATDVGIPQLPTLPDAHSGNRSPQLPHEQPVWHLQQDAAGQKDLIGEDAQEMASLADALPKPITAILPYYDYSPNREDACEYLCPRPEGCPDDEDAPPCPELIALPDVSLAGRHFVDTHVLWEPSNLFHNPLYFEDHALERYGHTHNELLQPFVSVGKFGAQFVGLPYQMALHPIHECQYTLGWHRPGECVPYRYHLPPWNTKAALVAAGTYTGLIFLFP